MSHIFTAEGLGRDFLSKSLGLSAARAPPSLLHNGAVTHANLTSQVISFPLYYLQNVLLNYFTLINILCASELSLF